MAVEDPKGLFVDLTAGQEERKAWEDGVDIEWVC